MASVKACTRRRTFPANTALTLFITGFFKHLMSQLVLKQQKNTYFVVLKFVRVNNTSTESIIV